MATLKQRLHRKNASGTYDTVHFESTSDLILRPSGRTVEQDLADYLPEVQNNDNVPESLKFVLGQTKTFANQKQLAYQSSVDDLFTSVSNGKELVANAITDKGVDTATDATFATMAENIGKIASIRSAFDIDGFPLINGFYDISITSMSDGTWDFSCNGNFSATTHILAFSIIGISSVGGNYNHTSFNIPDRGDSFVIVSYTYAFVIDVANYPNNSLYLEGYRNTGKATWDNFSNSISFDITSNGFTLSGHDDIMESPYSAQYPYSPAGWIILHD